MFERLRTAQVDEVATERNPTPRQAPKNINKTAA
jgi:hypothetical protein